jgi:hypothetical protein
MKKVIKVRAGKWAYETKKVRNKKIRMANKKACKA